MNNGGPAFPGYELNERLAEQGVENYEVQAGMSLRDYLAAAALPGVLTQWAILAQRAGFTLKKEPMCELDEELAAERAYRYADAMLATRGVLPAFLRQTSDRKR